MKEEDRIKNLMPEQKKAADLVQLVADKQSYSQ